MMVKVRGGEIILMKYLMNNGGGVKSLVMDAGVSAVCELWWYCVTPPVIIFFLAVAVTKDGDKQEKGLRLSKFIPGFVG
jgi:hypothetical protein